GVLIIDEAYAEFAGSSLAGIAPSHGRLVVVRTFSKAFGLAGLRVGYAVGAPALVREIEKARGPFRVSTVALRAAQEALTNDLEWMRARVADAITSREEFVRLLRARGFAPLPSAANFVLVPVAQATKVADRLWQNGIGVRAFTQLHRIGDAVRVTIAPREAMIRVADALATAVL
ncbi:MAG: aminotransferase class I/II-fold pyridoxal phosphate-dependent enzyme, partial [Gemmatimonadaceae bacterium]